MSASVFIPQGSVQVGAYDRHEQAQAAVDHLSDQKFPVEHVTIVGIDLRLVERVTGRLTWPKVLGRGSGVGTLWGAFVGLLVGLYATDGSGGWEAVRTGLMIGPLIGTIVAAVAYAATRGRRDFTSAGQVTADRYLVLCESDHAEEARSVLAHFALRG